MRCATVTAVATGGIPAILGAQRSAGAQRGASHSAPVAQETGQFSSTGTIVWLRVTDDGSVLVFAARGFRSAFAHPSVLTADETERWARLFAAFLAADSAAQINRDPSGGLHGGDTATIHGVFADGDVTLQEQMVGQALALIMRYGARGPAPVTATYPALALNNIIPTLHKTAELAKEIAAAHRAAAAAASAPAPAPATALPASTAPAAASPASSSTGTPPALAPSTAPVVAGPKVAPPQPIGAVAASVPPRASASPSPASPAQATPASVVVPVALPASQPPTTPKVSTERPAASQAPGRPASTLGGTGTPQIGYVVDPPDSRIQYTAAPGPASTSGSAPATTSPVVEAPAAADSAAGDSVAERALSSEGRLSPAVLGDVIRQRQQLLQYCYTEFGLRADPALAGQIVVHLVIQENGTVSEVTIPQHHWSGRGAEKVEMCIQDRVQLWEFPAAQRASTHEIQLIFGR